ncbi:ABC transporter ATP-binding protein [Aeromicrobium fastidiosum]|nr:ATP-binding cassette domain-containing protein [Aeromicrobium fastidiosum]MBP2389414.1 ABC-type glutathione transport system ATPase component [Aeromicrobium fastidiosum]
MAQQDRERLVELKNVVVEFESSGGTFRALDEVDLSIWRGDHLAVVGESGSGKTTLGRVLVGLQPFRGEFASEIGGARSALTPARTSRQRRQRVPGDISIQMVFQSSESSLDPRWTAVAAVAEATARGKRPSAAQRAEAERYLTLVGIPPHRHRAKASELSGGQRQRVAIARALALKPDLLICDEATSALDVATRASIITLLTELKHDLGVTLCVITHDFTTARALSDTCIVMKSGRIVEQGATAQIISNPQAEYSQQLLAAVPRLQVTGPRPADEPLMSALDRTILTGQKSD